jgi:hypothetical protein
MKAGSTSETFMCIICHRRGRLTQFGIKYWIGCSGTLIGVFILSQDIPSLRQWNPLYVTFTMVVILSEKVRSAICKGPCCCSST